jgi:hypothetical protein
MTYSEFKTKFGISGKQADEKPPVYPDKNELNNDNPPELTTEEKQPVPPITPPEKTGLAALSKKELLEFIGKKKLYDKSYKDLEPEAIIPLFIKSIQAKIVEAKLKTAEEAASIPEDELFALFDTLK